MIAFIYVTLTFFILQILWSTMLGEFLIFILHTIVFITVYFPFYSDHTYYQYFRILRDRSFSRISDEDWGKLFRMLLCNGTIHFVFLIFNVFMQLRKHFPFAAVNVNEFSLLTMIFIVRSIIFYLFFNKCLKSFAEVTENSFVSCSVSPFLSLRGCQLLFFFFFICFIQLSSCPPGVEQDLEELRALQIKIKDVRRVEQNLHAYLKFLINRKYFSFSFPVLPRFVDTMMKSHLQFIFLLFLFVVVFISHHR